MILCHTHKATYPKNRDDICWGHLDRLGRRGSSTDICQPYWVSVRWDEPYDLTTRSTPSTDDMKEQQ